MTGHVGPAAQLRHDERKGNLSGHLDHRDTVAKARTISLLETPHMANVIKATNIRKDPAIIVPMIMSRRAAIFSFRYNAKLQPVSEP
jgi:hypothetical protein